MSARLALSLGLAVAVLATSVGSSAAPKKPKKPTNTAPAKEEGTPFDKGAASNALSSVALDKCKTTNAKRGDGHVTVKFEPTGDVAEATVDRGPMTGTPVATCIAKAYKKAKVPAFTGDAVVVGKSFKFE